MLQGFLKLRSVKRLLTLKYIKHWESSLPDSGKTCTSSMPNSFVPYMCLYKPAQRFQQFTTIPCNDAVDRLRPQLASHTIFYAHFCARIYWSVQVVNVSECRYMIGRFNVTASQFEFVPCR